MERKDNSFYLYLQRRLLECCDEENIVDTKMARWKIINVKIPQILVWSILKDMEKMKLGKMISRFKFQIENVRGNQEIEKIIANHC